MTTAVVQKTMKIEDFDEGQSMTAISREILFGYKLGKGSLYDTVNHIIKPSLGERAAILLALDDLSIGTRMEMEIVAAISHLLGKPVVYSAPLRVALADDYARSRSKLVVSDHELMVSTTTTEERADDRGEI